MTYRRPLTCLVLCLLLGGATGAVGKDVPDADDGRPEGFRGCTVGTARGHCGTVSVPENRDLRDGRRLDLFVAVVPARTDNRRPEPIVVLEGGPGASVIHFAGLHVQTFGAAAPERDLVLVDQRGTGRSAPLDCDLTDGFTALAKPERTHACREALEPAADLSRYTTTDAVEDLADVLDHLGYERVDLFGVSNGTRTALHFARRYPERVRSILLLAPYPFERNVLLEGAATTDRSLDGIAAACASDPPCASAFPELEASIERLRAPDPPADVDWPLFTAMVRMMLFFPLPTTQIPGILDSVAADCRPPRPGRTDNQLAGWISEGAFLSILCAEDASRTSLEAVNERSAGSFLGSGWAESLLASCAVWPRRPLPDDFEAPIQLETPALLLVGGLDPAMPPSWSRELANGMPRARVIEVPEGQHSFIGMSGVGCVLDLMREFLDAGSAENLDATCVDAMRRPAFLIPGS